ncbi:MAG: YggT family protein [Rickettsiales bacterium]|nr:YggT family protein [Rickettsiales bacterium]
MLPPFIALINLILELFSLVIFVYIIVQLLIYFEIVNKYQPLVSRIMGFLSGVIEPILNKIRKYIKPINGVDISPVLLLISIHFVQYCLTYYFS